MRPPHIEPNRGRWVAETLDDERLIFAADTYDEVDEHTLEHPPGVRYTIRRIPKLDEPVFFGAFDIRILAGSDN